MLELQHELIAGQFGDLLAQEQALADKYASLAENVQDPIAAAHIKQILRDKQRHVELTRRLLEIVD